MELRHESKVVRKLEMRVQMFFELSNLRLCRVRKEPCELVSPSDSAAELQ